MYHQPDLLGLPLVAAGTERSLDGVDVRIRGAPLRCIGKARRKPETRGVGWSLNYIREEHARQAWKTLQDLPGSLTDNVVSAKA